MRDSRWRLWLSEQALASIEGAAHAAHPRETGGVLIGVHVHGRRPLVTMAVEVPSRLATETYYELPKGSAPKIVKEAVASDARLGYLGLWHSHPADVGASGTDLRSMRAIARSPGSGGRPVFIIARRRGDGYALDAHQIELWRPRDLRIVLAGGLPDAPPSKPRRQRANSQ